MGKKKRPGNARRATAEQKYKDNPVQHKLLYGLMNQGATCYLNSVLQVLFMTTELRGRLEAKTKIRQKNDRALRDVFEQLKKSTSETKTITDCFHITDVFQQFDASECLEMILNNISRVFSEVFRGELTYTTTCSEGHTISLETNPFWTLPLSLTDVHGSSYSVEMGFERVFQTITFNGDNMVYCDTCETKMEATSGCEMQTSPQILILLLKRFDFDYDTMSHFKSNCRVDIPSTLHTEGKHYELYGIVNHMGSLRGGHYTATVLSNEDNVWYEFNDSYVQKVGEQLPDRMKTHISTTAYLLIYRGQKAKANRAPENRGNPKADEQKRNEARQKNGDDKPNNKTHTVIDIPEKHLDDGRKQTKKQKKGDRKTHPNTCGLAGARRSPYCLPCIVVHCLLLFGFAILILTFAELKYI